jgi:hypothetical protein
VEVIVQECFGRLINHSESIVRCPNQVNEDLMGGQVLECPSGQWWPSTPFRVLKNRPDDRQPLSYGYLPLGSTG